MTQAELQMGAGPRFFAAVSLRGIAGATFAYFALGLLTHYPSHPRFLGCAIFAALWVLVGVLGWIANAVGK